MALTCPRLTSAGARRRWFAFAAGAVALFMSSVDQTIVATALTSIQQGISAEFNWVSWVITGYAFGQIVAMPLAGRLCEEYGRKTVFLAATGVFTLASLSCALVDSVYLLVPLRIVQALGGGAFLPAATGIVADQFGAGRDRALGLLTSIFPIGGVAGPVIGAALLSWWSWRGIFLVNVPLGVVLALVGAKCIAPSPRKSSVAPDVRGMVLLSLLILAAMYAMTAYGDSTRTWSPNVILAACAAVVLGWLFVRHARHSVGAFIPFRLLRGQGFGMIHAVNLLFGGAVLGVGSLVPTYGQTRYRMSAPASGALLTVRAIVAIVATAAAVLLLRRTAYRLPIAAGFVVMAGGMLLAALRPMAMTPYVWLTLATGLSGLGMGVFQPAANNAGLRLAGDQVAAVAGLRGMFRQAGGIIVVCLVSAATARYGDAGLVLARAFFLFAIVTALAALLVVWVPERRGSW